MDMIYFISAKQCDKCDRVRQWLETLGKQHNVDVYEIDSETDMAIRIALEMGIDDLPGIGYNHASLCGEDIDFNDIELFIKQQKDC